MRCVTAWCGMAFVVLLAFSPSRLGAAETRVLHNSDDIWVMTNEERELAYQISIEGRINYFDPAWRNLWFEQDGVGRYIALSGNAPKLRNGQLVRIEGTYVPAEGLSAARVNVTVLKESAPATARPTAGRITEVRVFDRSIVETEGYVDDQLLIDNDHLRLSLLVENRRVICWVPPDNAADLPEWQGRRIRVRAVYSGRLDPSGTDSTVELWVGSQSDVEVRGSIDNAPEFDRETTPIDMLHSLPLGSTVKIQGSLSQRDIGTSFVLSDQSGSVLVECLQRETLERRATVDVVGRTAIQGSRWVVLDGIFRKSAKVEQRETGDADTLTRIDEIRQLAGTEAAKGRRASVTGIVTWSLPEADFFFLQDQTGGVRVRLPSGMNPPPLQKMVRVEGGTSMGGFTPVIELEKMFDLGSMAHPRPELLSYARAISGTEDGQWVEMRGFIRRTASEGDWRWIYVTTPDGEFVGHLQSPVNFVATPGSLLRVRGVCEVTTDAKNRINGVRLRIPFLHDIIIEEDAPAEVYDLPLRRVEELRSIGAQEDLIRAHIRGVVILHMPGQYIVVQDGDECVGVFSREPGRLKPGDSIEAVGILGEDGARVVLREAVFRLDGHGSAPAPAVLEEGGGFDRRNDLKLVQAEGVLLDFSRRAEELHLTLQSGNEIYDAVLEHAPGENPAIKLEQGMTVAATGIYRIAYDDFHRPRGFALQLRDAHDLAVLHPAPFWTSAKAAGFLGVLSGLTLLVVVWVTALRIRVRVQTAQIRTQLEKQASLEAELERSQRFRSLGLLAGGLAHDFNNLLTGILGNVTLAMLEARAVPLVGDCLRDIEASAKRARDLTQQLVTFAKGGDPMRETLDLAALLHDSAGFALSGANTRAVIKVEEALWAVHADRNQLGRAVQNLLIYSRSRLPDGGIITIRASNAEGEDIGRNLAPGRYVRLSIADTGSGITPEQISVFFDPYSATKFGDDRFSLAIAYSILKRHGGNIEVRSEVGHGTEFLLWIPTGEQDNTQAVASEPKDTVDFEAARGTRVLLMDDEETIRRLAERLLARMGCEVKTVADGDACLARYREALEAGRRFHIVILDLTVPGGMGGRECMEALLKIDPHVRGIVSSGYSNDPVMANYRAYGFRAVVPKPYVVGSLADSITRVLGAPQ